jgi:hypothetical protein
MKQKPLVMTVDQTFENYRKPRQLDEFLKTMGAIVPWAALSDWRACIPGIAKRRAWPVPHRQNPIEPRRPGEFYQPLPRELLRG